MEKFKVKVIETLQREVEVEAGSAKQAVEKAMEMYRNEEITLNADDYIETCICDDDETIIKYV